MKSLHLKCLPSLVSISDANSNKGESDVLVTTLGEIVPATTYGTSQFRLGL
jgi:hypothetical protein